MSRPGYHRSDRLTSINTVLEARAATASASEMLPVSLAVGHAAGGAIRCELCEQNVANKADYINHDKNNRNHRKLQRTADNIAAAEAAE